MKERKSRTEKPDRFFNLSSDAFLIVEEDGSVAYLNDVFLLSLGLGKNDLSGGSIFELIGKLVHPDEQETAESVFRQKPWSYGPVYQFNIRCRSKNGIFRWFSWMVSQWEEERFYIIARDITEQRNVEYKNIMWESILDHLCVGVMGLDSEWQVTCLNKKATGFLRKSREEIEGKCLWKVCPELISSPLFSAAHQVMFEMIPVHLRTSAVYGKEDYEIILYPFGPGILICLSNMTKYQKMEKELQVNELRLEALLKHNQMGQATLEEIIHFALGQAVKLGASDLGWMGFVDEKECLCQVYSWSAEGFYQYRGSSDGDDLFPPFGVDFLEEAIKRRCTLVVSESITPGGKKDRSCPNLMVVPLFNGERIVMVGGVADKKGKYSDMDIKQFTLLMEGVWKVVQKHEVENKLRLSEERFAHVFEYSPSAMSLIDVDTGKCVEVNKCFERITGYLRTQIIGRSLWNLDIWLGEDRLTQLKKFGAPEFVKNFETKIKTASGTTKIALVSMDLIGLNGQKYAIFVIEDITERKQMENEMIRLERLNLIGEMAAGISHEIRNPLSVARGFLQLLGEKPEYLKDKEYLDLTIEELDRANSIITEFLSLARNKPLDTKMLNLNLIMKNIFPLIEADAMVRDMTVKLDLGGIPDLLLDEKEIRQLVLNLSRNGLEAMSSGGVLGIKTCLTDGAVVLAISDQGRGIEPGVLEKIGTPFFTTKDNGTGLGLAVCYSIVARNNGTISIDTGPKGTTFWVQFKM